MPHRGIRFRKGMPGGISFFFIKSLEMKRRGQGYLQNIFRNSCRHSLDFRNKMTSMKRNRQPVCKANGLVAEGGYL